MKKAIFWDLLGTLGGNSNTLVKNFCFFKEAVTALKLAQAEGYLNFVITNQSHIAHGRLTLNEYEEGLNMIKNHLRTQCISIEKIYTCPHKRADGCKCKKPQPKFVFSAQEEFDIDLSKSYIVGDTVKNDIVLAHNTGTKGILVLTGGENHNEIERKELLASASNDLIADNALAAMRMIMDKKSAFDR